VSTFDPQVFFADKSLGADLWTWTFGDTNNYTPSYDQHPDFTYSDHGYHDIMLIAENNYGCVDTIVRTIYIYADIRFYVPSAFTPNEDGRNDVFRGFGEDISGYNMRIFTRTGDLIFESNDIDFGWDGTVNGRQVPNGMYIYEFTVTDLNDQSKEFAGRFTLVR
jgi:gliding motility-associated-like protein